MSKRPKINIFLKLFYLSLKGVVLFTVRIFYGKVTIINKKNLSLNQACILLSNHPSTMMDPLNVACRVNRIVHFLANASLFQSSFGNWFFNTFYCIPVARQKDKMTRMIDNEDSFQRAFDFLEEGGCLYVAPEGVSTPEHDLKPLKTGTARIALGVEAQHQFKLDLTILPVGIYYKAAQTFRQPQLLNVGEPIRLEKYQSDYKKDPRAAVQALTKEIESEMSRLLIVTEDSDQDQLFRLLENIQQEGSEKTLKRNFEKSKKLSSWIKTQKGQPILTQAKNLHSYLAAEKIQVQALGNTTSFSAKDIFFGLFAPFGWLFNVLPASLALLLKKKLNLYDGYSSSVLILSGLVLFPIFYRLNNFLLAKWINIGGWWPLAWLAYLLLGVLSWNTLTKLKAAWQKERFRQRLGRSEEARAAMASYLEIKEELKKI